MKTHLSRNVIETFVFHQSSKNTEQNVTKCHNFNNKNENCYKILQQNLNQADALAMVLNILFEGSQIQTYDCVRESH